MANEAQRDDFFFMFSVNCCFNFFLLLFFPFSLFIHIFPFLPRLRIGWIIPLLTYPLYYLFDSSFIFLFSSVYTPSLSCLLHSFDLSLLSNTRAKNLCYTYCCESKYPQRESKWGEGLREGRGRHVAYITATLSVYVGGRMGRAGWGRWLGNGIRNSPKGCICPLRVAEDRGEACERAVGLITEESL